MGFSGSSGVKNQPANEGDTGSIGLIPESEGNGNTPWFYCLGNPMDRGDWWVTAHGITVEHNSAINTFTFFLWNFFSLIPETNCLHIT